MNYVPVISIDCPHPSVRSANSLPSGRCCNSSLDAPSKSQSLPDTSGGNFSNFGPLGKSSAFTAKFYDAIVPFVSPLLFACRPAHVGWLVVSVVIFTIQCMFFAWPVANVLEEGSEVIAPFFAHCNSACAITGIACITWVVASTFRAHPNLVFGRVPHPVLSLAATASLHSSRVEVSRFRNGCLPAIAPAFPVMVVSSFATIFNHEQPTKSPVHQVFESGVRRDRMNFSHSGSTPFLVRTGIDASTSTRFVSLYSGGSRWQ